MSFQSSLRLRGMAGCTLSVTRPSTLDPKPSWQLNWKRHADEAGDRTRQLSGGIGGGDQGRSRESGGQKEGLVVLHGFGLAGAESLDSGLLDAIAGTDTHRKPTWLMPVSGGSPRRALGR